MKKLLTALTAIVLLLALTASLVSCSGDDPTPEGMKNVATEKAQALFDLYVPELWIAQTESGISGARVSNTDTSNVTVTVYFPDEELTPESYWQGFCLPQYTSGVLADFKTVDADCKDTTLGGKNAKQYVFVYKMGDVYYQAMQIITVHGGMVFTMTYTAEETNYAANLESVEWIRSEFVLK